MAFIGILVILFFGVIIALIIKYAVPLLILGIAGTVGIIVIFTALAKRSISEKARNIMLAAGTVLILLSPIAVALFLISWQVFRLPV